MWGIRLRQQPRRIVSSARSRSRKSRSRSPLERRSVSRRRSFPPRALSPRGRSPGRVLSPRRRSPGRVSSPRGRSPGGAGDEKGVAFKDQVGLGKEGEKDVLQEERVILVVRLFLEGERGIVIIIKLCQGEGSLPDARDAREAGRG